MDFELLCIGFICTFFDYSICKSWLTFCQTYSPHPPINKVAFISMEPLFWSPLITFYIARNCLILYSFYIDIHDRSIHSNLILCAIDLIIIKHINHQPSTIHIHIHQKNLNDFPTQQISNCKDVFEDATMCIFNVSITMIIWNQSANPWQIGCRHQCYSLWVLQTRNRDPCSMFNEWHLKCIISCIDRLGFESMCRYTYSVIWPIFSK